MSLRNVSLGNLCRIWLVALFCFALCKASPATAQSEEPTGNFAAAPPAAPFSGSFSSSIPIEVPAFHGVEPRLALSYDSTRGLQVNGRDQGWLGLGWRLDGVSIIERVTPGRGAPNFTATDIYTLDGDELIACGTTSSPGCVIPAAEGTPATHATRVESYNWIRFDSTAKTWTIKARDGTTFTYRNQGTWYGSLNATGFENIRDSARYFLQTIADTNGNTVTYDYVCFSIYSCHVSGVT